MKKIEAIIKFQKGKKNKVIPCIMRIVFAIAFFVGFFPSYNCDDYYCVSWYGADYVYVGIKNYNGILPSSNNWGFRSGDILFVILYLIGAVLLSVILSLVVSAIREKWAERMSLKITDDSIIGNYGKFSTKALTLPIERLDNISVVDGFMDKFRSGKTIVVRSSSSSIKFPMCQNADDFCNEAIAVINEYKKNYVKQEKTQVVQNISSNSNADELKKYKELLDAGIITQEEFDAKKAQLLGL